MRRILLECHLNTTRMPSTSHVNALESKHACTYIDMSRYIDTLVNDYINTLGYQYTAKYKPQYALELEGLKMPLRCISMFGTLPEYFQNALEHKAQHRYEADYIVYKIFMC